MKELEKGVDMEVHDHGVQKIQGYVVAGTADLPARSAMLNSIAHNECVSEESVKLAKDLIDKFLSFFEDMYGQNYLTLNFHLLHHLGQMMVHGTRFPESQIASSLNVCLALPEIVNNLKDSKSKDLCNMLRTVKECKSMKSDGLTVIGDLTPEAQLLQDIKEEPDSTWTWPWQRIIIPLPTKGHLSICCCLPSKMFSRDSSCVQYIGEGIFKMGII
ncbi:hypothetical protein FOCC_FOCC012682 [Frankliniella occidentalis]|nr:hypothetical protein FOCC_FOCC012682 [Frankliniella occidentalis]